MTTRVASDNQRAAELLRSAAAKLGPAANPATVAMANAVADSIDPPRRACYFCGKALSAHAGFIETISQPDGLRRDFCSAECLHWQLHEDEKAE